MGVAVRLPVFEGPLDLLLHLIRTHQIDLHDIPIARITEQYLEYLALMEALDLEVASEFLVMAATLMEMKSRLLLPRPEAPAEEEGPDPRAELVRRLVEYERIQRQAERLRGLAEAAAQRFGRRATRPDERPPLAPIRPADLVEALRRALAPAGGMRRVLVRIQRERIRLEDRIRTVWETIAAATELVPFRRLLGPRPSRAAIVVTFLAVLELVRDRRVTAWQAEPLGEIYLGRADSPPEAAAAGEVDGGRPPVL